jgi:ParB family chromosome partitioning protein
MSITVKSLTYRGDIKGIAGVGGIIAFVTLHPEDGHSTAIWRLDPDRTVLNSDPLPQCGISLVADGTTLYAGGNDGFVYRGSATGGAPVPLGDGIMDVPRALALLSEDRLAVLTTAGITILSRKDGRVLQTLELPPNDEGTVIASDPTGQWLVAGTDNGNVVVFECEDKPEFALSAVAKLHEGSVSALLFEQEELRFLSAGADQKLLSTHARGKLEPEDRGKGSNHSDVITSIIWGPNDRFYTGSRDKTVKNWPRTGGAKPATLKDGIGVVVGLTLVKIGTRQHLVVANEDNSIRLYQIDQDGRFTEETHRFHDAYAWAAYEFTREEAPRREEAIRALAQFGDSRATDLLSEQVGKDADHSLRLLAVQLLGDSKHPKAAKLLEPWLNHKDEAVRIAALQGLRKQLGENDLKPLDLALKVEKPDVGRVAVQALEQLAKSDDQALARLQETLKAKTPEIRQAGLASLENVYPPDSAEANLFALTSTFPDTRRLTLIRLFQRRLLDQGHVQAAVRWREEDADADVRRTAFLLTLYARPHLVQALRERDKELNRQLVELETFGQERRPETPEAPAAAAPEVSTPATRPTLEGPDYNPLLQAIASRALDTCLRGARGLAVLGDPRAFGLLLQLSREDDAPARVEVCRALAALDDPRSIKRLRSLLYDADASVRDAAFSALVQLHQNDPLQCAESGLNSAFEDVRRRGLQLLIQETRASPGGSIEDRPKQLLGRALNDSFAGVRGEAFKAALRLNVGGDIVQTMLFVRESVHPDIRREVLTEVMAQINEPWAWGQLIDFYNDPDAKLRDEAFTFAVKKGKELAPLEAGLASQYTDIRKQSVDGLIKKHTPAAQALLVRALADREKEVRQLALGALVGEDARAALIQALQSPHADVIVRAARALARHGERAALAPLLRLATAAEPEQQERKADWLALAEEALLGLADLGDNAALGDLVPLLNSKHASLRKNAAIALMWVALPHHLETLRQALQHSDPQVKYRAALGLAFAGDPLVASLVFSDQAGQVLSTQERLVAAFTLGPAGEDQLVVFLDSNEEPIRNQALLLLLLLELKANGGAPTRILACLSSKMPRVRLTAAGALECFGVPSPPQPPSPTEGRGGSKTSSSPLPSVGEGPGVRGALSFPEFVVERINERGDDQAWQIAAEVVDKLAELVVNGAVQTRARSALLLRNLSEKEQAAWDQAWETHAGRYAAEITALEGQARKRPPVPPKHTPAQLQELAFGAYVGLVREQGGKGGRTTVGPQVVRVRQTALRRVLALATSDPIYAKVARPVLVQALGDPNQPVRTQAFESLQTLGMDSATLGGEALETGYTDLGVKGLEVLSGGASSPEGQQVLETVMLNRKDDLAIEAAKLLAVQRGQVAVAGKALEAAHEPMRRRAVEWLTAEYEKVPAAQEHLGRALQSRYQAVREAAAFALANKKDRRAFESLVKLLQAAQDARKQQQVISSLETLGDPRAPDAFMDRLENDPAGTANGAALLRAAGNFRKPENADRLLGLMERNVKWRTFAYTAVYTISGFDQRIQDMEDDNPDKTWEQKQHPRRSALLAKLMEKCFALGEMKNVKNLIRDAKWARGRDTDGILAVLTGRPEDDIRRDSVEALGWRMRKRQGQADPLLRALAHKDPSTQFLAAEGLARAGRGEGLGVLLAAAEFLTDPSLGRRAVRAMGELADARALDLLLKLVNDDTSPLQADAAEAIGHMGRSPQEPTIYALLERHAKGYGNLAESALKGLRWLNTHSGWQMIRRRADDDTFRSRRVAVELLGFNDDPATRDLLLKLLANVRDRAVVTTALASARKLFGDESLEPDYALLQNPMSGTDDASKQALKRVSERGEARRIFEVLVKAPDSVHTPLSASLLNRPEVPLAEAQAAISSQDERTVRVAAQLLGRAGKAAAGAGKALQKALETWRKEWDERRRAMIQRNEKDARLTDKITPCLQKLLWAAGRLGVAQDALLAALAARPDDGLYRPIRVQAVAALTAGTVTPAVLDALQAAALGGDPEVRTVAADALGRHDPRRATALAGRVLKETDSLTFNRLVNHDGVKVDDLLRQGSANIHDQGVTLPHLIGRGDVEGLSAVAQNRSLPEATRLGAVEALARMARETAEARLVQIGTGEGDDEEVRKAAWRGLRRSKRARAKAAVAAAGKA